MCPHRPGSAAHLLRAQLVRGPHRCGVQAHDDGQLMELDWAAELRSQPGMERVMTAGALLSPDSKMPADHLVSAVSFDRVG